MDSWQLRLAVARAAFAARTERERARVWWRECAACNEGDAIPDLSADSLHNLNPWIVTPIEKYPDPRAAGLEKARQVKQEKEATQPKACAQCKLTLPAAVICLANYGRT